MGLVHASIQIANAGDIELVRRNMLEKEAIRSLAVNALVDSSAYMMAINETFKNQLGLFVVEHQKAQLADGQVIDLEIVGPVEIRFENRRTVCEAVVLPGDNEVLLGLGLTPPETVRLSKRKFMN